MKKPSPIFLVIIVTLVFSSLSKHSDPKETVKHIKSAFDSLKNKNPLETEVSKSVEEEKKHDSLNPLECSLQLPVKREEIERNPVKKCVSEMSS